MPTVIRVENLSKYYRLGLIGGKTLHDDLNRWWARVRKRPDPLLKIGQEDRQNGNGEYLWALRDVSFEVQQGEIVGIIGRNGAGKSTLLKILSRITAPTSGQVKVKGRIASLLEVGTGFHPELTGRENIYLNGAILGMKKAEIDRKFDEIVAFAEVEKFIDTPVKRYSSGMYVRLAFAVAAHLEPEILIVDEVLAVGDVAFQKKCLGKMGEVAKEGRTVLFVSHNMVAMQRLCERVVWLNEGTVIHDGVAEQVVASYLQRTAKDVSLLNRCWKDALAAPGNQYVRIHKVYVCSINPNANGVLRIDQAIKIGIKFWVLKHEQNICITFHILTSSGITAFSTSTAHNISLREKRLKPGLYETRCLVPENLLNNEVYNLKLLVVKDQTEVIYSHEDIITFELSDSPTKRGAYMGKRPGVFAPILDWEMQQVSKCTEVQS